MALFDAYTKQKNNAQNLEIIPYVRFKASTNALYSLE